MHLYPDVRYVYTKLLVQYPIVSLDPLTFGYLRRSQKVKQRTQLRLVSCPGMDRVVWCCAEGAKVSWKVVGTQDSVHGRC